MSKIGIGEKKYILIPEARPLFALGKAYGPKVGPLSKPTPVLISVIGELLHQTDKNKVTILEVAPTKIDPKTKQILRYGDPVTLTLSNYMLPYEEILNGKNDDKPLKAVVEPKPEVIIEPEVLKTPAPVKEPVKVPDPVIVEQVEVKETFEAPAEPEVIAPVVEAAPEEPVERAEDVKVDDGAVVDASEMTENTVDPWPNMTNEERAEYAKMSKSERKAARRAHREQVSEG